MALPRTSPMTREKHDHVGQPIDVVIASAEAPPSPPPDGGYGWVCVLACFCVNAFTWGVVAVGSPFSSVAPASENKIETDRSFTHVTDWLINCVT